MQSNLLQRQKQMLEGLYFESSGLQSALEQVMSLRAYILFKAFVFCLRACGCSQLAKRCQLTVGHKHDIQTGRFLDLDPDEVEVEINTPGQNPQTLWVKGGGSVPGVAVALSASRTVARRCPTYCEVDDRHGTGCRHVGKVHKDS
jgi:hypothetical protein